MKGRRTRGTGRRRVMRDEADDGEQTPWLMRDTSWSRLGLPLAAGLLALTPAVSRRATRTVLLTYLQLPIYMFHQYEEHGHGAFKREINALVPPASGHLTDRTIFWVNSRASGALPPSRPPWRQPGYQSPD